MFHGGITAEAIDEFLDYVFTTSNLVPFELGWRPASRGPDDERILDVGSTVPSNDYHPPQERFSGCGTGGCASEDASRIPEHVARQSLSVTVSVPDALYQKAVEIARAQDVSVDEVFASAFAEQLARWDRLKERATRGSREKFLAKLDKVPDVEPEDYDRI